MAEFLADFFIQLSQYQQFVQRPLVYNKNTQCPFF